MQQNLSYAVAIIVVLSICCLGMYVAVSGFVVSAPPSSSPGTPLATLPPATILVVISGTETPKPIAIGVTPTAPAIPSPLGAFQTITAAATLARPSPTVTARVAVPPTAPPQPAGTINCAGFAFCPQGGPPDSRLAPTGAQCPRNYVWGQVIDANGRGITDMRIRFKGPLGEIDSVMTKGSPDPPGIYNILAPSGTWTIWMLDSAGNRASPEISVTTQQAYSGAGNCPTRMDFAQRK